MLDITRHIAMIAGPYLIVSALGFLASTEFYRQMTAAGEATDKVTVNLSGACHFIVGMIILTRHFLWGSAAEITVTLLGAAATLKGAVLIALPQLTLKSARDSKASLYGSAAFFLIAGAWFSWVGYGM